MATRETKLPSIPDVPDDLNEDLRGFLSSIKEIIETREGNRANALDRNLLRRDLSKIGIDVRCLSKDPPSYPFRDLVTGEWKIGTKLLDVTDPTAPQDAATKNYVEGGNFDARIKGWIQLNGTGTIAIQDSYNVSGIVDLGVGIYQVTWDTDFANDDYSAVAMSGSLHTAVATFLVGSVRAYTYDVNHAGADSGVVTVIAIGDQ